jgi:hypothetical protein
VQLLTSASRLAHGGVSSGTAGSGDTPGGGAVKAGPPLGVGFKVMVRVSSEVGPPGTDGDKVRERVRVDGVCAWRASAAGVACAEADA